MTISTCLSRLLWRLNAKTFINVLQNNVQCWANIRGWHVLPEFEYSMYSPGLDLPAELDTKYFLKQPLCTYYLDLWFLCEYLCWLIFMVSLLGLWRGWTQRDQSEGVRPGLGEAWPALDGIAVCRNFPGRESATCGIFLLARGPCPSMSWSLVLGGVAGPGLISRLKMIV